MLYLGAGRIFIGAGAAAGRGGIAERSGGPINAGANTIQVF